MQENLERLLTTLNQIEVKGEANLNRLLGCIQFLHGVIDDLKKDKATAKDMTRAESGRRADEAEDKK